MAGARAGMKEAFAAVHECLKLPQQRGLSPRCRITAQLLDRVLSSLFPDPVHLDDVTTISVY